MKIGVISCSVKDLWLRLQGGSERKKVWGVWGVWGVIFWILGKKTESVVEITGYSRTWIYALVKRYNEFGVKGLCDRRCENKGATPLINDVEQAWLWQALQGKAPSGGLWNGRKVADWLGSLTEPIANRSFEKLDDLEEVLFRPCQSLLKQQDLIQGLTSFHWWTQIGV